MSAVKIKFLPACLIGGMYRSEQEQYVRDALAAGMYTEESKVFSVNGNGEDGADEVFDLTNNPGREDERRAVYGNGRSLSTGDIVVVDDEQFLCKSFGWVKL